MPTPKHMRQLTTWQVFHQIERRLHNHVSNRQSLSWQLGISPPSSSNLESSWTSYVLNSTGSSATKLNQPPVVPGHRMRLPGWTDPESCQQEEAEEAAGIERQLMTGGWSTWYVLFWEKPSQAFVCLSPGNWLQGPFRRLLAGWMFPQTGNPYPSHPNPHPYDRGEPTGSSLQMNPVEFEK